MKSEIGVVANLLIILITVVAIWGWVWNIVKIFAVANDPITGMFILRCCGIIVAPLGAVLGFL